MQLNDMKQLNGVKIDGGKIKQRKRKKYLSYEEIREIHAILDQHGPKNGSELARRFDVSPGTMSRTIKAWHEQRGTPPANVGGGMAAAIKRELLEKLSRCKNVSEMRAALRDCLGFLE